MNFFATFCVFRGLLFIFLIMTLKMGHLGGGGGLSFRLGVGIEE